MQLLGLANEQRDVIMVDLRGTGGSNKLVCPQPADPALRVEALQRCLATLNGDPRAYTSAWATDDVDDVRAALSYDQINLYGGSYGGFAAQVYILRHGDHVRTAAADGTTLLENPFIERWPITSQLPELPRLSYPGQMLYCFLMILPMSIVAICPICSSRPARSTVVNPSSDAASLYSPAGRAGIR